jgi:hypothetical protein
MDCWQAPLPGVSTNLKENLRFVGARIGEQVNSLKGRAVQGQTVVEFPTCK